MLLRSRTLTNYSMMPTSLIQGVLYSSESSSVVTLACWFVLYCWLSAIENMFVHVLSYLRPTVHLLGHVQFHTWARSWYDSLIIVAILTLLFDNCIYLRHKVVFLKIKYLISLLFSLYIVIISFLVCPWLVHLLELLLGFLLMESLWLLSNWIITVRTIRI